MNIKKLILTICFSLILSLIMTLFMVIFLSKTIIIEQLLTLLPNTFSSGKNILVFGIDDTQYTKRADSIMLIHVNPQKKHIGVISIPRDTRVNLHGIGMSKINHAYAYEGVNLLKESVSDLLGLPIHHYVKLNINQVSNFINKIGGIEINVKKNLVYQDYAGDLNINIKKGIQKLDGNQAIQYLRFRKDRNADIGRIKRQQHFVENLSKNLLHPKRILELPSIIKAGTKIIDSDLKTSQIMGLAKEFINAYQNKTLEKTIVPGHVKLISGSSYWRTNIKKLDEEIEKVVLGIKEEVIKETSLNKNEIEITKPLRREVKIKEIRRAESQIEKNKNEQFQALSNLNIELLNGCGVNGIASKKAEELNNKSLKIVKTENAGHFNYQETKLVDWKNNTSEAIALANALNIDPKNIIVYDLPQKNLDITIVIGNDWIESIQRR
eukprot:COSAG01_NODE_2480_length_7606_cov_41.116291_2_plen_438_part_00